MYYTKRLLHGFTFYEFLLAIVIECECNFVNEDLCKSVFTKSKNLKIIC